MFTSSKLRAKLFKIHYRLISPDDIDQITKQYSVGDWYLLYMIGANIDAGIFSEVFQKLVKKSEINCEEKLPINEV